MSFNDAYFRFNEQPRDMFYKLPKRPERVKERIVSLNTNLDSSPK